MDSDFSVTMDVGRYDTVIALCFAALEGFGVTGDDLAACRTALAEAVSNACRHAYGDGTGVVGVDIEARRDSVRLAVTDYGRGRAGAKGGNGIRLMRAYMDKVDFTEGNGLRVEMTRKLARAA